MKLTQTLLLLLLLLLFSLPFLRWFPERLQQKQQPILQQQQQQTPSQQLAQQLVAASLMAKLQPHLAANTSVTLVPDCLDTFQENLFSQRSSLLMSPPLPACPAVQT